MLSKHLRSLLHMQCVVRNYRTFQSISKERTSSSSEAWRVQVRDRPRHGGAGVGGGVVRVGAAEPAAAAAARLLPARLAAGRLVRQLLKFPDRQSPVRHGLRGWLCNKRLLRILQKLDMLCSTVTSRHSCLASNSTVGRCEGWTPAIRASTAVLLHRVSL